MKKRFDSSEMVPKICFCYFGFVGVHTEPLQVCSENLRKGFEGKGLLQYSQGNLASLSANIEFPLQLACLLANPRPTRSTTQYTLFELLCLVEKI